jgi:hypothetical protein
MCRVHNLLPLSWFYPPFKQICALLEVCNSPIGTKAKPAYVYPGNKKRGYLFYLVIKINSKKVFVKLLRNAHGLKTVSVSQQQWG